MTTQPSRRRFLTQSAGLAVLAAAGVTLPAGAARAAPASAGRLPAKLKTSLNAFSFNTAMTRGRDGNGPDMTLMDVLDFCAQQDFEAIDPTGYYFPGYPHVPTDAYLADFKRKAFDLGLEISGTGIRNNFATADATKRAADVELAKRWIEAAAKMGAPVIRLFAGQQEAGVNREDIYGWMAEDLHTCAEFGQQHGVVVGVQNHNDFVKNAAQTIKLVKRVDHAWLGVILDTGNFRDNPYPDIAAVLPYTVNFQLKESPYGKDSDVLIDLDRFVQILVDAGYRGYVPIETLTPEGTNPDMRVVIPRFMTRVRRAFARVG
ncbi:sugar phosphate isomerase/epimerase family protein [Synoicihabitans lomoniglobus]|uniref:Sugar phosphate isomerase/epimerase n=1 Tax=Synoicihabitans lomoniglobus TaxID=2909285 RepID=A0AAF0CNW3_9BACT|nr:sugar phosphate isomerase/epimerase [Opitutaceae bacterium LMO-M01]WED65151.1 sugar phosphate isomerase/epimerase [Opitutaceae bacterium LMO-M01]